MQALTKTNWKILFQEIDMSDESQVNAYALSYVETKARLEQLFGYYAEAQSYLGLAQAIADNERPLQHLPCGKQDYHMESLDYYCNEFGVSAYGNRQELDAKRKQLQQQAKRINGMARRLEERFNNKLGQVAP